MLEIRPEDIRSDDMEAIDKLVFGTVLENLNALEEHLKRDALSITDIENSIEDKMESCSENAKKKILKILINDERKSINEED